MTFLLKMRNTNLFSFVLVRSSCNYYLFISVSEKSWWSREYVSDYSPFILNKNDTKSFEVLIQDRFKLLRVSYAMRLK